MKTAITLVRRLVGHAVLAFALSACTTLTPQQRAAQMENDFGAQCRKLGHVPDSGEYKRCLQMLHNAEVMDSVQMMMGF